MTEFLTAEENDRNYLDAFGMTRDAFEEGQQGPFPIAYLTEAASIVDRHGIPDQLAEWEGKAVRDRYRGGRKRSVPLRAVLILMLMMQREGRGISKVRIALTMKHRLDSERMSLLGIKATDKPSARNWYDRFWRAEKALLDLIEPYPFPKYRRDDVTPIIDRINRWQIIRTREQVDQLMAFRATVDTAERQRRIDWLTNRLVLNTVDLVRDKHLRNYIGNTAVDATYVPVMGNAGNPDKEDPNYRGRSVEFDAGYWAKSMTNHDGSRAKMTSKDHHWGYDGELVAMTRNGPLDRDPDFPILTLGVGFHVPGSIQGTVARIYENLYAEGFPSATVTADRAYPALSVEDFQQPLIEMGHELVFDYRRDQLGNTRTASHDGLFVQFDGNWHLSFAPPELRDRFKDAAYSGRIDKMSREEIDKINAERALYRLTPHGRRNANGAQRYKLPDPNGYRAIDWETGEVLPDSAKPTFDTVTIPGPLGLKSEQRMQFKSKEWEAWYALRPTVEHMNGHLKDGEHEAIDDPETRRGRGYAYQYLVFAIAAVSGNLRKIHAFFQGLEAVVDPKAKDRGSKPKRRKPRNPETDKIAIRRKQRDHRYRGLEPPEHRHPLVH